MVPTTDSSPRPSRPPSLETLARFAFIMALLVAVAAFPQSAIFSADDIRVVGAVSLSPDDVARLAGVQTGERLFAIDVAAAAHRLRTDPRIAAATVGIVPPRTVVLRITERHPVVAVATDGQYALVGDDLVVAAVSLGPAGLPVVIERTTRFHLQPGVSVTSEGVRQAIQALPLIPPALRSALHKIVVAPGPTLTLLLFSGLEVRAGRIAGLADRLASVEDVLRALQAQGISAAVLDLRYDGVVAVTPVGAGEGR